MIITAVCPAKQHTVTLRFDNGSEIGIDKTVWEESPYGVGSSLSCQEVEALGELSERRRAENKAVFLLSKRDLSRRQLEEKLCREKGRYCKEKRESAEKAAARMEELGYVNDERYAYRVAEQLARVKLYPPRRIVDELIRRGIHRELAREAAASLELNEIEMALAFLKKKRYTVPKDSGEAQRIAAAMARYGYSAEAVRRALQSLGEELPDDECGNGIVRMP